jgi:hypothetical protein
MKKLLNYNDFKMMKNELYPKQILYYLHLMNIIFQFIKDLIYHRNILFYYTISHKLRPFKKIIKILLNNLKSFL